MTSTIKKDGQTLHIALRGDLTGGAEAMRFAKQIREQIATAGSLTHVVINMNGVGFVDSSGLGMLLGAREAAQSIGATLRLEKPNEQFTHLLELTKLTDVLGVKL